MKRALWLASGVILWAVHFLAAYGYAGLACARGWGASVPWTVGALTLAAAAIAAGILVRAARRKAGFEDGIAGGLAAFALLAIVWEGAPVLWVAPCVSR